MLASKSQNEGADPGWGNKRSGQEDFLELQSFAPEWQIENLGDRDYKSHCSFLDPLGENIYVFTLLPCVGCFSVT